MTKDRMKKSELIRLLYDALAAPDELWQSLIDAILELPK
jgi:hypothetical protein